MHTELLAQGVTATTRRAIFLIAKYAEGHQLEQLVGEHWGLALITDELDLILNPNDYRIRLYAVTEVGKHINESAVITPPNLRVVANAPQKVEQDHFNDLAARLLLSI